MRVRPKPIMGLPCGSWPKIDKWDSSGRLVGTRRLDSACEYGAIMVARGSRHPVRMPDTSRLSTSAAQSVSLAGGNPDRCHVVTMPALGDGRSHRTGRSYGTRPSAENQRWSSSSMSVFGATVRKASSTMPAISPQSTRSSPSVSR